MDIAGLSCGILKEMFTRHRPLSALRFAAKFRPPSQIVQPHLKTSFFNYKKKQLLCGIFGFGLYRLELPSVSEYLFLSTGATSDIPIKPFAVPHPTSHPKPGLEYLQFQSHLQGPFTYLPMVSSRSDWGCSSAASDKLWSPWSGEFPPERIHYILGLGI